MPLEQGALWPGKHQPLGTRPDKEGTNFALFSRAATNVRLCLFDEPDQAKPTLEVDLKEHTAGIWHGYMPGVFPRQLYGYRVDGPYKPEEGLRFNKNKLLLDPYAKAITGCVKWDDALFGYIVGDPKGDLSFDERDSAPFMPKCAVVDESFDWEDDTRLDIPWNETIIYEAHVKGLTKLNQDLEENIRGTYAGIASPQVIDYLKKLGVTAVELLPVHHFINDRHLVEKGLSNYWGYNTIGFLAPDARYSSSGNRGEQVVEFKNMVKQLHKAGIEVILDVVYNHTAEGNQMGPTLSLRGIDNGAYYNLAQDNPRHYVDYSGTGNAPNIAHAHMLQLIMDSLRYWTVEMRVDGFRFDLAAALAHQLYDLNRLSCFFDLIHQDPILANLKLIAEPWDLSNKGYMVGQFPALWSEWNDRYRDAVRRFWRSDPGQTSDFAYRIAGSSDLYGDTGRQPYASINFVTSHDGFTLNDLVSYDNKHNDANPDPGGMENNNSWNCGAEGPADDKAILDLRARQRRNFLATVMLSQGVPMLAHGDEIARTQKGNNNVYCQDNELSWMSWDWSEEQKALLDFTRKIIMLRKLHPVFRRKYFIQGTPLREWEPQGIAWLTPDGNDVTEDAWKNSQFKSLAIRLSGYALIERTARGDQIKDDTFLILLNGDAADCEFKLPGPKGEWEMVFDSANNEWDGQRQKSGESRKSMARSLALFRLR